MITKEDLIKIKKIKKLLDGFLNSPPDGRTHNDILIKIDEILKERDPEEKEEGEN
tara:strand:- start:109 stop:273 length:165 start_codon:yes stop_codon:yes gene_type:complete